MIADSDGNMRPSKKMVIRMHMEQGHDQKMQRYVKDGAHGSLSDGAECVYC